MFRGHNRLLYYAFDLLHIDVFDLRDAPLGERRLTTAAFFNSVSPVKSCADLLVIEDGPDARSIEIHLECEMVSLPLVGHASPISRRSHPYPPDRALGK